MSDTARTQTDPLPELRFVGGDPSLDLVNTIDWIDGGPPEHERLVDYDRLTRWAEGAGVLSRTVAEQLRQAARSRPERAREAVQEARRLRSLLQRLFASVAAGERDADAWRAFDRRLADTLASLTIAPAPPDGRRGRFAADWNWRDAGEALDWFLHPVVRAAAELLTSDEARRIRVCDGEDCGWMFVDRSRNRLRRWCQMETCGTAAKSRRRRERNRAEAGP